MNKLGKMNKPKRFHFVSFSFETFSTKFISINNFQKLKKPFIIYINLIVKIELK